MTIFTDSPELPDFDFEEDINHAEKQIDNAHTAARQDGDTLRNEHQSRAGVGTQREDQASEGSEGRRHKQALGLFPGISNFDYHNGSGISSSELKQQLKAPKYYHAHDIGEVIFEQTKQMRLGSAVHILTLEPFDFNNQVALLPKYCQGNAKNAKENREEFELLHPGKIIIYEQEYETVQYMRDALLEHPEAGEILLDSDGEAEMSGYYIDKDEDGNGTYQLCKYRPDFRLDWGLFDIKSTVDASREGFKRIIGALGYHVSGAHYLTGENIINGTNHNRFFFLCVEPKPPYLVAVYKLGEKGLRVGHYERRKALHSIKQCRANKHWPGYNNDKIESIDVPNHLIYSMEQEQ